MGRQTIVAGRGDDDVYGTGPLRDGDDARIPSPTLYLHKRGQQRGLRGLTVSIFAASAVTADRSGGSCS